MGRYIPSTRAEQKEMLRAIGLDDFRQLYKDVPEQMYLERELNIPSGTQHELCYAIHAEQNAIIQAAKLGISIEGATLYCTHQPCVICAKMIVNSGIARVVYGEGYPDDFALRIFEMAGVELLKYEP